MAVNELLTTTDEFLALDVLDPQYKYELLGGVVCMSPSPSRQHQDIIAYFSSELYKKARANGCNFTQGLGVRFDDYHYLIPDMMVECTAEIPLIVMEVLSPSNFWYDLNQKKKVYKHFGIREYWIIDPENKNIVIHWLQENTSKTYENGETAHSLLAPWLEITIDFN